MTQKEKTFDKNNKIIRPGDIVEHFKFGKGFVNKIDLKTYSIPFLIVDIETGKFKGETIYRDASEFKVSAV